MGLMQKDANAPRPRKGPEKTKAAGAAETVRVTADDEDERLWQEEFQASMDVLSDLADKALADYEAGRTKKINA